MNYIRNMIIGGVGIGASILFSNYASGEEANYSRTELEQAKKEVVAIENKLAKDGLTEREKKAIAGLRSIIQKMETAADPLQFESFKRTLDTQKGFCDTLFHKVMQQIDETNELRQKLDISTIFPVANETNYAAGLKTLGNNAVSYRSGSTDVKSWEVTIVDDSPVVNVYREILQNDGKFANVIVASAPCKTLASVRKYMSTLPEGLESMMAKLTLETFIMNVLSASEKK